MIDAALPAIFPVAFLGNNQIIVAQLALYFLTLFAFYFREETLLINAFVFGMVTDSYNTTILGIYATLYVVITYVIIKTKRYFPQNAMIHLMMYLVAIAAIQFCVFVFYRETGYTTVTLTEFLAVQLWPTLIFNLVLSFLMYFPSKLVLNWLGYERYVIL